ncbi:MAG: hypothetical protein RPR98_07090 [Bermanella sp.]
MKTTKLILTAFLSGTMLLGGCLHESSDEEKAELAAFLAGYAEEEAEDVSTSEALEKDYIGSSEVVADDAAGNAKIGGEIDVESLNKSLAKMNARSMSSRAQLAARAVDTISTSDFTISFINGKGQLVELVVSASDILIHQPSTGNPQFIIEGVGSGINYIVEVKLTVDNEQVDLKALAFVPPGATKSEKAVIDPVSTVITEAIQNKVVNSFFETGGDALAQEYIADLTETLVVAIEEVIASGDFTVTQFEEAIASDAGVDDLVTKVLSDETVAGDLNKIEDAAVADTFAVPDTFVDGDEGQQEARNIVEELLNKDEGEGGGAPQFFIDFFGDQYQLGTTKTVDEIVTAIFNGIEFDIENTDPAVLASLSKAGALTAFTTELFDIYAAIDTVATLENKDTLNAAEAMELQALRGDLGELNLLLGIFPPAQKSQWQALTQDSELSVPQAISLIFYVLDTYLEDLKGFERNADGQLEESDGVDFDPIKLLEIYGFDADDVAQQAIYANLEVNWLDLHPSQVWLSSANSGNGGQVDILQMFTCVDAYPTELFEVKSVSLTFPKKDGSASDPLPLKTESEIRGDDNGGENGDGHDTCYTLNPWAESDILAQSGNPEYGDENQGLNYDAIWQDLVDSGVVVTDFGSGTYTLTVVYSKDGATDSTSSFTFDKRIITGLSNLFPRFTSPLGLPHPPEGSADPAEWEAFNAAQSAFTMTNWATADLAVFEWSEPALLATTPLPEGVVAVYNMDIGRDICGDDPETDEVEDYCRWQHVFSSWETGSQIFETSFILPADARAQLTPLGLTDTPYQANLSIDFIDENSGEFLGSGGYASAPFRIGDVLDLDQPFTITGSVSNAPNNDLFDNATNAPFLIGQYKVAAVRESCNEDTNAVPFVETYFDDEQGEFVTVSYFPWVCSSETLAISALTATDNGHSYSLMPNVSDMMGNSNNSWIDIRLFIDTQVEGTEGFGIIDQPTEDNDYFGEPQFWSQGGNVNFNTWGGVLRISTHGECNENGCDFSEEIVIPDTTYEGPDFDVSGQGPGGNGGDDGNDDGFNNINAFFTNDDNTFLGTTLEWDLDPSINEGDITGFRILLFEVTPTPDGPRPAAVLAIDAPGNTLSSITIDQMLNGGTNLNDITALAVESINADIAEEGGTAIVALTSATLLDNKAYEWFVEAYGAGEDEDIGKSNDVFIAPAPPATSP